MLSHSRLDKSQILLKIRKGEIQMAGNLNLKIYGMLHCKSGKRMKMTNRVFFKNEEEALQDNFRPCGHCLKEAYQIWKNGAI